MTTPSVSKPALLSASYLGRGRGVSFEARFACGHIGIGVFPHAKPGTSRAELARWLFGGNPAECCSRDCLAALEAQS